MNFLRLLSLSKIERRMKGQGITVEFAKAAVSAAAYFDGVYDLLVLWLEETNTDEKSKVIADIQDALLDSGWWDIPKKEKTNEEI